jgi:hypothetical protein
MGSHQAAETLGGKQTAQAVCAQGTKEDAGKQ